MIIQREKYLTKIYQAINRVSIVVLIGARQVGKTSLLKSCKFSGKQLFLNGQNPEIAELFQKFSIIKEYLQINLNNQFAGYLFIDEFQYINNISTSLKLLSDSFPDLKIICTGSSSLDILQKVEESLAGRISIIEVFSLSFEEYLLFQDKSLYQNYLKYSYETPSSVIDKDILYLFDEYLVYGGFPRIALEKKTANKVELIDDIYKTYLLHDVRQYIKNQDVVPFNKLLKLLASQIGSMINTNELSIASGLTYKKTEEYLALLEQMYIIKLIEPYFTNKRKVITKMKKLYFTDLGLRNIIYQDFKPIDMRIDNGALFENMVLLELLKTGRKTNIINYYRTVDGSEIDFIINNLQDKILIETKYKNIYKPIFFKNIESFKENETVIQSFIVNKSFNYEQRYFFIPGVIISKIFSLLNNF